MGQSSSRPNACAGAGDPLPSRFARFRRRLRLHHRHRGGNGDDSASAKNIAADDFAGIARIRIVKEKKVIVETNGPHIARISVFETNRFSKNTLVGYCEVDLFEMLTKDLEEHSEDLALLDPSSPNTTVGSITISCYIEDPVETEQSFARRVLAIVDYDEDGTLSLSEFSDLMKAFGNKLAVAKIEELFRQADTNGDGIVDIDELAALLADQQEKEPLISNCPVCGEDLGKYDKINDMIHMTLCFDEGTGVKDILKNLSEKQGKKMNSPESAKDIPKFLELFKDQINMDEVKDPIESFKTFNEFFVRGLKPGARPIAYGDQDSIATCAADSRLMAFSSVDESTRFWIKGRKFSIEGLLGPSAHSNALSNGSLVIFRLAPQDYHRFHVPVSGTVEKFVEIPGFLYTVNPIAVNSKYCNVFTENKRVISIISTSEFGKVAFVAIGATMVGSITFLKNEGDYVHKGDEFGYFSFGGSTVICVFEKDAIQFDADLLANSERSLETLVSVGMTLGMSTRNKGLQVP
ncbi:Phosphatidylserine decarboxylase proenzyme 2 [Dichanthelium oligosanthes]|uniref:phosphatidylserine decarboxylase n=1 Tax=Dichanthelium oligosanthes TaxID=888268 RepID=A0A1E5WDU7_9POAL|nr:Phosphatidylserine decarboxylase proenzyme 2 [Dichanthelium oligosanthes]